MGSKKLKKQLKGKKKRAPKIHPDKWLHTGSTLLNCALTGNPNRGFAMGLYYFLVGDSASGKTFLSLTCLAEAAKNKHFDSHRFIFDDIEGGALMDFEEFFGADMADRVEPPKGTQENPEFSSDVDDFYYNLDNAYEVARGPEGKPFIYVMDSMDSIDHKDDEAKFQKKKKAAAAGTEEKGTYGMAKAKANSQGLRRAQRKLRKTDSILIIISQTRDNVDQFSREKKSRGGGRALKFYAHAEMWSANHGQIQKEYKKKKREQGLKCGIKVKKNRHTGRRREVVVPIYHSYGFDDTGSCVDYLIDEGWWKKRKSKIVAPEFDIIATREKLIDHIEENEDEPFLHAAVGKCWNEIEDAVKLKRKKRYE